MHSHRVMAHVLVLQATSREQSIRIQSSGGLSEDQIQQMVRDAEAHSEADKARKAGIEAKNEAETAIISAERSVKVRPQHDCMATEGNACAVQCQAARLGS